MEEIEKSSKSFREMVDNTALKIERSYCASGPFPDYTADLIHMTHTVVSLRGDYYVCLICFTEEGVQLGLLEFDPFKNKG